MIKLIKSTFYKEKATKKKLVSFIMSAKQLSLDKECHKFEKNFADFQGRKYCVFFNSGSSANMALIQALINLNRLKKQDMVGFSALTWSTNVMPLIQLALRPIPIDVELETLNVSSKKLIKTVEKYPLKALFITNLLGFCDDIDKIKKVCASKKILLIEDNCEALGTVYKNKKLGNFGLASTFSFFVGHHMSTIEGGAVCTDDKELAGMLRIVRAHGWDRHLEQSHKTQLRKKHGISDFHANYTFYELAYNLRPTEINGFLGNNQLANIDEIIEKRNKNFIRLANSIYSNTSKFIPIKHDHIGLVSNFAFPVICRTSAIRNDIANRCKGKIEIRPIVGGDITQQPFFKKHNFGPSDKFDCKNAKLAHHQGFYFGNNPELTNKEIEELISVFSI